MRLLIVTGMSGAGKASVLKILEDKGFYCVDNLPVPLLKTFADLMFAEGNEITKAAIGIDIRNGKGLQEISGQLEKMESAGYAYEILFMDASDATLIKRYKETRRVHPIHADSRIEVGIQEERRQLEFLKKRADYIIDTSKLLIRELNQKLDEIFFGNQEYKNMLITIVSFGFKYGIPADSDLVFDVRFLPNPYYVEELKHKTGNQEEVQEFVCANGQAKEFLDKLGEMIQFLIPKYILEGKNQLVIGIGCTGGKHRSVTIANKLYEILRQQEKCRVKMEHRDITK